MPHSRDVIARTSDTMSHTCSCDVIAKTSDTMSHSRDAIAMTSDTMSHSRDAIAMTSDTMSHSREANLVTTMLHYGLGMDFSIHTRKARKRHIYPNTRN